MTRSITLANPSARDEEIRDVVVSLVNAFAFAEANAVLTARLKEIRETRQTHVEALLIEWFDLPTDNRPDFLTFAHHRRNPQIGESS